MKRQTVIICALLLLGINLLAQYEDYINMDNGSFTDDRDGQEYNWVKIGKQIWMAENLNIGTRIYIAEGKDADIQIERYCYHNDEEFCWIYGGLYPVSTIERSTPEEKAKSICPEGWHLPDENEWQVLIDFLGGPGVAGVALKEAGINHWRKNNAGTTNSSGFTALPGGYCTYDNEETQYFKIGKECRFWSSTDKFYLILFRTDFVTVRLVRKNNRVVTERDMDRSAHSIRCIKD